MQASVFLATAIAVLLLMLAVWAISVRIKDASIVDIVWGLGFVLIVWVARFAAGGSWNTRQTFVLVATLIWGLRLGAYLGWRNIGKGEDFRYRAMRKKHGDKFWIISLRTVFLVQGVLMWIVSTPTQIAQMNFTRDAKHQGLDGFLVVGSAVWLIGVLFESIGDLQLAKFKANPENRGKVMDRGLWAWTRHPNYFGDVCVWWGIWLMATSAPLAIIGIVGPIVMTFFLVKVSGVPMLEHSIAKRRPGYTEYVKRTSSFFPRPPKKS
jgi:steroid 5-alpha reductase family enzyme